MSEGGPLDEDKMDGESAEAEFQRFADEFELDIDEKGMDDEDRQAFQASKKVFIRELKRGSIVVDERGAATYTTRFETNPSPVVFHEPTGATFMASDQKKRGHDAAKMYAMIADMTRQNIQRFSKMPRRDLKVVESVALLFLG